jgi:hypothetical protein
MSESFRSKLLKATGLAQLREMRWNIKHLTETVREARQIRTLLSQEHIRHLLAQPKYQDPKRLNRHETRVYSQNGEDGILEEIFRRIGMTNRFFTEFGVQACENNSLYLLLQGWRGIWLEGSPAQVSLMQHEMARQVAAGQLTIKNAFITAENIETLFRELQVPAEPDLLSIDIDGNDYWIWKAVTNYRPRVLSIEYNPIFPAHIRWVMKYNPTHVWQQDSYQGASLKSLELLSASKGYTLVGCDLTGTNAFFVRDDLVGNHFAGPFTAENHYEPARYYLQARLGHPRAWGEFETV